MGRAILRTGRHCCFHRLIQLDIFFPVRGCWLTQVICPRRYPRISWRSGKFWNGHWFDSKGASILWAWGYVNSTGSISAGRFFIGAKRLAGHKSSGAGPTGSKWQTPFTDTARKKFRRDSCGWTTRPPMSIGRGIGRPLSTKHGFFGPLKFDGPGSKQKRPGGRAGEKIVDIPGHRNPISLVDGFFAAYNDLSNSAYFGRMSRRERQQDGCH